MGCKKSGNLRREQATATKQKLLESAQRLFAEKGYKGTSVRSINRSVNLADGLLYHYFPGGKKEIFQAVVGENLNQILDALETKNRIEKYVPMPLSEVLETAYQNFIETVHQRLDIIRILFRENEVQEFVKKEDLQRLVGKRDFWFPELLRIKRDAGEVRDMDFDTAALMLNSILMNHVLMKIFGVECSKLEDADSRRRLIDYQVHMWTERN